MILTPDICHSPGIECDSDEAADLRSVAVAILIIWPAGSLLALAAILFKIRGAVARHQPSNLSTATKVNKCTHL